MVKIIRKFGFLVCIAAVLCSGYGSVLCYGPDGHIAIAPVFHSHCDHDMHEHGPADHDHPAAAVSDTCYPCDDVAVGTDMEPVRLYDLTQMTVDHINPCLSDIAAASNGAFTERHVFSSFFTPLETIRLMT